MRSAISSMITTMYGILPSFSGFSSAVLAILLALVLIGSVMYPLISMVSAQAVSARELEELRKQADELAEQKKAKSQNWSSCQETRCAQRW